MSESDLLSKDEVDALLDNSHAEGPADGNGVRDHDLANNDRIVRGRLPALELVNERFSRLLETSFFSLLRQSVDVNPAGIKGRKYDEFSTSLPTPCSVNLVTLAPLTGTALVVFTPELICNLVDRFFGGSGCPADYQQDRDFTPTELGIMDLLLSDLIANMREAWSVLQPVEIARIDSETNPRFAQIANPLDLVIDCAFQIELAEHSGTLHLTYPYAMLEPIRDRLENGTQSDSNRVDERWLTTLREEVARAQVRLRVTVARTEIAIHELMEMKAGDVIAIDMPQTVIARAEGVPLFRGTFGVHNSKYSIRMCEPIQFRIDSTSPQAPGQGSGG